MDNTPTTDWVRDAIREGYESSKAEASARKALVDEMVNVVEDGIMVLKTRDNCPLTEHMARERAKNIVAVLITTLDIKRLP